ncbi:hemerythrin family protein [Geitlerinema sp. CS-897]|nr:hemerythrin family protein [Geitlerinema sp. CS-897]
MQRDRDSSNFDNTGQKHRNVNFSMATETPESSELEAVSIASYPTVKSIHPFSGFPKRESMHLFIWDESLEVGIPSIDNQHRHLVEQLSLLLETLYQHKSKGQVEAIFKFLALYLDSHFHFEERCMAAYQCPAARQNCIAHIYLRRTLQKLEDRFQREGVSVALIENVRHHLYDWFLDHIRTIDVQLKRSALTPKVDTGDPTNFPIPHTRSQ